MNLEEAKRAYMVKTKGRCVNCQFVKIINNDVYCQVRDSIMIKWCPTDYIIMKFCRYYQSK